MPMSTSAPDSTSATSLNQTRIAIDDLPRQGERATPARTVHRLRGDVGTACVRTCDCADGLVCREGTCTDEW